MTSLVGIVTVSFNSASSLPNDPSPFATATLGSLELCRTETIGGTPHPVWNETLKFALVGAGVLLPQTAAIDLNIWSKGSTPMSAEFLGSACVPVSHLAKTNSAADSAAAIYNAAIIDGSTLDYAVEFQPLPPGEAPPEDIPVYDLSKFKRSKLAPSTCAGFPFVGDATRGLLAQPGVTLEGVVKVKIDRATGLDKSDDTFVRMRLGKKKIFETETIKNAHEPVWKEEKEFFLQGRFTTDTAIQFSLMESDTVYDSALGTYGFPLSKLLEEKHHELVEPAVSKENTVAGKLTLVIDFTPMHGKPEGMEAVYLENVKADPVAGKIDFYIEKAENIADMDSIGKTDPFIQVWISAMQKQLTMLTETDDISNTLNPVWRHSDKVFIRGTFLDAAYIGFRIYGTLKALMHPHRVCS